MSRFERRAAESMNRKAAKNPHATQSFANLVGRTNQEALKPFVIEVVGEMEQALRRDIARMMLEENARIQTRLMVLEKLAMEKLGETPDSISERVLQVEDEATGHVKSDAPAQVGDLVRVTWQVKVQGQEGYGRPNNIIIHNLANTRMNPATGQAAYQTYENLEKALVGASVGDEREVEIEIVSGEAKIPYTFKAKVDRISRNLNAAPAQVVAEAQEVS